MASNEAGPPPHLQPGPYREIVEHMWQQSPTFRAQCARLAAEDVIVSVTPGGGREGLRAHVMTRQRGGRVRSAEITIYVGSDMAELIAHEIEHVLEQLDGVDLRARQYVDPTVTPTPAGFETKRAIEAGRRVAQELRAARPVTRRMADSATWR